MIISLIVSLFIGKSCVFIVTRLSFISILRILFVVKFIETVELFKIMRKIRIFILIVSREGEKVISFKIFSFSLRKDG